ncbi:MFS transporter [Sulfurospirillum arcachonense]|uniref:MFS transporter n=1 Tax=Sulfurospirillum arcachonense TaxID=57666 RepID=UPI00046AA2B4|nr:MFS transporter [Sulfurospirillum arcachonense]
MENKTFQKAKVFTISFAHLSHDIYSSFLAPLLPLLIAKLEMSLFMAAFLDIARRIPALFNPFFGLIAEKTGAKYFVILTPAITAISMSLVGLASSYVILFILLFVAGISAALFHVPSPTMIKESSGQKVGTGMSFFMVGGELARTIGPLIATAGVSWWGLEGIYKLMPLGLIASIILYIKLKDFDTNRPLRKPKEKGDTKKLLKQYYPFFIVMGSFLLFQSGMKSTLTLYLPVYLVAQGESLWHAGISLSILQFFGVLGTFVAGNISDRIGRKSTLAIASIGSAISMALFIYFDSIFVLPLIGLFLFATGPVLMATVQDTNSHMPTFMNSMYMSINFGVSSAIVFGVGLLGDHLGLETTYIICNVLAVGCIPMAFLLTKYIK